MTITNPAYYGNTPIVVHPLLPFTDWRQIKYPRSKKKRIRKKFKKDCNNFGYIKFAESFMMDGVLYVSQEVYNALKENNKK